MSKQSKKIGIAVVGAGRISVAHLESIRKLADKIKLVAIVDINEKIAKEKTEKYGSERYYTKFSDALRNPEIEAVRSHKYGKTCIGRKTPSPYFKRSR